MIYLKRPSSTLHVDILHVHVRFLIGYFSGEKYIHNTRKEKEGVAHRIQISNDTAKTLTNEQRSNPLLKKNVDILYLFGSKNIN